MSCLSCGSSKVAEFSGELSIRLRGLEHLDTPNVLVFPQILICLDCGSSRFTTPKPELRFLSTGNSDDSIMTWVEKYRRAA
jgi:hypothetical protein